MQRLPVLYLPHGAGPCFFMDWPGEPDMWKPLGEWLASIGESLVPAPKALLVISAHWEASVPTVLSGDQPPLVYDYSGFPPHTYRITWPAPGDAALAARVQQLLAAAALRCESDAERGFDHGTFIPLKLAYPRADVPTVQLSLKRGLDAGEHFAIGRALAPLRQEGVFIVGSGMSYHNMRAFGTEAARAASLTFDAWLTQAVAEPADRRGRALAAWQRAPEARNAHPREEHLLPLMVVAGAAGSDQGRSVFRGAVLNATVSAFQFG